MIYFKCSQCGEKMEAPESLRGQLLKCPKCGLHQKVKKSSWLKYGFVILVLLGWGLSLFLVSFYSWKNGRDLGLEVGIKKGIKVQQLAFETTLSRLKEREKNNPANNVIEKILNTTNGQIKDGFVCQNVSFQKEKHGFVRVIGEMINQSKRRYDFANFKISCYNYDGKLVETSPFIIGTFLKEQTKTFDILLEVSFEQIYSYKIDFESGL